MPRQIAAGTPHRVDVVEVTDGDTIDVRFPDGTREELRMIGLDTPETKRNQRFERPEEWEGIEDPQTLVQWGERAKAFARERLTDATVTVSFDPSEPVRDQYDRLLVYLEYDHENETAFYNRELVEEGLARVYDSGVTNHDAFLAAERDARTADRGLWAESDPSATPPMRNRAVDDLFVPRTTSVRTVDGRLPSERAPVVAEGTATQELRSGAAVEYSDRPVPLVGVDRDARVGLVGGLLLNEAYEAAEGFPVDTAGYEQFVFATNLLTWLADRDGDVLVDGAHGQFGVDYALSAEDAAYYQRYLEGQGVAFRQQNGLSAAFLDEGRAMVVTPPVGPFGDGEVERVRQFRDAGGCVLLLGSAAAPAYARRNLDRLAAALGSDLRLNDDRVRDEHHNLDDDPTLPTTTRFDRSFPLFAAYGADRDGAVRLGVQEFVADPQGDDRDPLADEHVTFVNHGDRAIDLGGWTVADVAGHDYTVPDGVELGAGATLTLHTGGGDDTAEDLYWGRDSPVWNNRGDTVVVTTADGSEVLRESY